MYVCCIILPFLNTKTRNKYELFLKYYSVLFLMILNVNVIILLLKS